MGKINNTRNYPLRTPVALTKLVGSDPVNGNTYNYQIEAIKDFVLQNGVTIFIDVTDPQFGAVGDGVTDNAAALQACADYCAENDKIMYIPYSENKYLTSRPIVPHRTKGITVYQDGIIKNSDPAYDKINLNGVVWWAGCITHPYQKYLELVDDGAYLHRLTSVTAGDIDLTVDSTLYNALSVGDVVLVRSDLLSVDRTGEATGTVPNGERFGVYNFSVLNKVTNKFIANDGSRKVSFEHPFEETIYEPRLLRFPTDQYVDGFQDDPKLYIGPCENFHLYCTDRGGVETSGNQSFIQATCLYNFSIINVNVIDAAGGVLCNSLNYGVIDGLYGSCRGSSLEIAFNSTHVQCYNIFPTVRGRGNETNPNVRATGVAVPIINRGKGAIDNSGNMDYIYDAIWYGSVNKQHAVVYNKDDGDWDYFTSDSDLWDGDLPVSLTSPAASGWGSNNYFPEGTEGGITMTKALSENKSTVNIHEGARNIWIDNLEVSVAEDYAFIDQDINLVGTGISVSKARIYSNKYIDIQSGDSLEGDSISIGNAINGGDIPFSINDIEVDKVTTSGRPVNAVLSVTECPLFPSVDTTTINLRGSLVGSMSKLNYNYLLTGATLAAGVITRAADSTQSPDDRYYAYYSTTLDTLAVFSKDGYAGKGKGWYLLPATSITEPAASGDALVGVNYASLTNIYDKDDSFSLSGFGSGTNVLYLGAECEYVIFGPCKQFVADVTGDSLTFVPNNPHRTFRGLSFSKIRAKRAALRGAHIRGGVRNLYEGISFERFIDDNLTPANVPSTRYLLDIETTNSNYVSGNMINNIQNDDASLILDRETIRDQGYSNQIKNVLDNRNKTWKELYRRYFRTNNTGTMRQILDNTPAFSVTWPLLTGNIPENETVTFDTLNWAGGTGFRTGYSLDVRFIGICSGTPEFYVKGGNPSSLTTIQNITLDGDFELDLHIQFLDSFGAVTGSFVSVSYMFRSSTTNSSGSNVVDLSTTGGTRQIAFEVVTVGGEELDIYSYVVTPKTNTYE